MTEHNKTTPELAVQALNEFLRDYYLKNRIPWMHDVFGSEFHQGRAHALTGLALIPELRTALDAIDEPLVNAKQLGSILERWHEVFKSRAPQ
jgi:hypothetical protein